MGIGSLLLRLFRRAEPLSLEDPELGLLTYERGRWWTASIRFDGFDEPLRTLLRGGTKGPQRESREALRTLQGKLRGLLDGPIRSDLREAELGRKADPKSEPSQRPEDIFEIYLLVSLSVEILSGKSHVEIGFKPAWSEDHHIWFYFDDWEPSGISMDS